MLFLFAQGKKRPEDLRINLREAYEVQYWSKKWGISALQLEFAIKASGTNIARHVEAHLRKTGKIYA